ncbi:SIMPL domain-containing protein [Flavobacterium antarcticum]|uniref:SIMPL domain-containing protein n=1 Tax=Flavobacterium antarcticum TaxID=271155 RepID=UPI0003B3D3C8|nr:SIMPL domain-containing protein [Flavobacterium antarcticum]
MKKNLLIALTFFMAVSQIHAQDVKPLITVTGEGKVKVVPDQVSISVSVESKGTKAAEVKKANDTKIDGVLKFIKKMGIANEDFQTTRVSLNDQYDYEKKKHNYVALQSIQILIKDLAKYDQLMEGLVDSGINNIGNIEFKSSKIEIHKSEARKLAIQNAKMKAQDYIGALGQKLGMAYTVVDNSQDNFPRPRYEMMAMKMADGILGGNETLAEGEIDVTANVSVSFLIN